MDVRETEPGDHSDRPGASEEDVRDYARRLRSLPVEHVLAEVMFTLLNAAQVKLGRRDARLLIDAVTVSMTHARGYVSAELSSQVDGVLGQLRLVQVAAEGRTSRPDQLAEENDLERMPTPPAVAQAGPPSEPASNSAQTSRLWVPGR
jgi:hypothetical protein